MNHLAVGFCAVVVAIINTEGFKMDSEVLETGRSNDCSNVLQSNHMSQWGLKAHLVFFHLYGCTKIKQKLNTLIT